MSDQFEDLISNDEEAVEFFGSKECRWYQIAARNQVAKVLKIKPQARILVHLPTGAGKTITSGLIFASQDIREAIGVQDDRKMVVLFIAHKHRLLSQAEQAYAQAENIELILQSAFSDIPSAILDRADIVCIDEAHHEAMSTIQYHLDRIGGFPIIGLTATPDRADGCLIKFDEIIQPITREQAVAEGWLAPTNIHSFIDVPSKEKVEVLTDILENFGHQMGQTMIFVKTKKEVVAINKVLRQLGYVSVGIVNQTNKEVNTILNRFSAGEIQFIINCNKISEGVDVVGCTDVILGRQFGSYAQLNQVIGRASRPDSDCNVYELINPLSNRNLDTTVIVGTPEMHRLVWKQGGKWQEEEFDYVNHQTSKQLGIVSPVGSLITH